MKKPHLFEFIFSKRKNFTRLQICFGQGIFSSILISKMGVKMNLRIITKNHAVDPEKGFLTKSISKPYGRATAMPPAWKLN